MTWGKGSWMPSLGILAVGAQVFRCTHVHTHIYARTFIYTHMHMCTPTLYHRHTHIHTHAHTCTLQTCACNGLYAHMCLHLCACMCMRAHACVHIRMGVMGESVQEEEQAIDYCVAGTPASLPWRPTQAVGGARKSRWVWDEG